MQLVGFAQNGHSQVSFQRGTASFAPEYSKKWQNWELPFLQWLDPQSIRVDLCTENDLHFRPDVVNGYWLLVIVGHSEYWSGPMRDAVENHAGNVLFVKFALRDQRRQ
jgi:hypothetical protein